MTRDWLTSKKDNPQTSERYANSKRGMRKLSESFR